MKRWSVLGLTVLCGAVVVWLSYAVPVLRAEDDMMLAPSLPRGFTATKAVPLGTQGMPHVIKIVFYRVEAQPGAKWPNLKRPSDVWDFCYGLAGEMTMTLANKTNAAITPSTAFTFAAGSTTPLFANNTKHVTSYVCWEFLSKK